MGKQVSYITLIFTRKPRSAAFGTNKYIDICSGGFVLNFCCHQSVSLDRMGKHDCGRRVNINTLYYYTVQFKNAHTNQKGHKVTTK